MLKAQTPTALFTQRAKGGSRRWRPRDLLTRSRPWRRLSELLLGGIPRAKKGTLPTDDRRRVLRRHPYRLVLRRKGPIRKATAMWGSSILTLWTSRPCRCTDRPSTTAGPALHRYRAQIAPGSSNPLPPGCWSLSS